MVKIVFIWVEDEVGWIGKDNDMFWYLLVDLKYFKYFISGYLVIMGKNIYLFLGWLLFKWINIVVI